MRSSDISHHECQAVLGKWFDINCSTNMSLLFYDVEEHWDWNRTPTPAQLCNPTHLTLVHLFLDICLDLNPSMIILKQALWNIELEARKKEIKFLNSVSERIELELKRFASLIRLCLSRYRELKVHPDKLIRLVPKCTNQERSVILVVVDKIQCRKGRPAIQARLHLSSAVASVCRGPTSSVSTSAVSGSDWSSSRGSSDSLDDILMEVDQLPGSCPSAAASESVAAAAVSFDRQFEDDLDTLLAAIDDLPDIEDDSLHQPAEDEELAVVAAEQIASGLTSQPLADVDDVTVPDDTGGATCGFTDIAEHDLTIDAVQVDQEDRDRRQALSLQPLPVARGALPKNKGPGDQSAAASAKATAKLKHRLSAKTPAAEAVKASASAKASATASAVVPF